MLGSLFDFAGTVVDKLFPDADEAEKRKLQLVQLQQAGEFKELESRFSAIVAEAQSRDPWTSRARPSFLYVMYLLLLSSVPFGIASVFFPGEAARFTQAFGAWFGAIPGELYALFGAGYLGYSGLRSWDKGRRA